MVPTALTHTHWETVLAAVCDPERRCVPFLGAGVNSEGKDYAGLPLAKHVTHALLGKLMPIDGAAVDDDIACRLADLEDSFADYAELVQPRLRDLPRVAFHVAFNSDRTTFIQWIKDILCDEGHEPSPVLQALARLPFKLIVTTNYDRLLERALGDRKFTKVVQPIAGFSDVELSAWEAALTKSATSDELWLYKIHGSFVDPVGGNGDGATAMAEEDVLITEEDYITFLTVASRPKETLPTQITARLTSSVLLFLGYGLQDWDIRTMHKGLIEHLTPHRQRKSFAIQKDPSEFWVGDLLKKYAGKDAKRLTAQIDSFTKESGHPSSLTSNLHHFREVGDFGAHTQEDENASIIDVDREEAEWTLDLVDRLFDYFIVQPAKDEAIKGRLDAKIERAGRKPLRDKEDS
jgi:hypothetical protein